MAYDVEPTVTEHSHVGTTIKAESTAGATPFVNQIEPREGQGKLFRGTINSGGWQMKSRATTDSTQSEWVDIHPRDHIGRNAVYVGT